MNRVLAFLKEEDGATAIEYGLIAGLIGTAIVAVMATYSTVLEDFFTAIGTKINGYVS